KKVAPRGARRLALVTALATGAALAAALVFSLVHRQPLSVARTGPVASVDTTASTTTIAAEASAASPLPVRGPGLRVRRIYGSNAWAVPGATMHVAVDAEGRRAIVAGSEFTARCWDL